MGNFKFNRPLNLIDFDISISEDIASINTVKSATMNQKRDINITEFGTSFMTGFKVAVLAGNCRIFFPKGTWEFGVNQITFGSNVELYGEDGTIIKTDLAARAILFTASQKHNIKIHHINFISDNASVIGFNALTCTDVEIYMCDNTNVTLLKTDSYLGFNFTEQEPVSMGYLDESYGCNNIKVYCNKFDGGAITEEVEGVLQFTATALNVYDRSIAGVELRWCTDAEIWGNEISGIRHGIMYWGGNSSTYGTMEYERWCKRIKVYSNYVHDVRMGGIWGGMGQDIQVWGNTVERCYDVGIDFEGSIEAKAWGNTVKDCSLGCLATFFYCKDVQFSDNDVSQRGTWLESDLATLAVNLYYHSHGTNTSLANGSFDITLSKNKFKFLAKGVKDEESDHLMGCIFTNPIWRFNFVDNECENVIITQPIASRHGTKNIKNNELTFKYRANAAFNAIYVNGSYGDYVSPWATGATYSIDNMVWANSKVYICTVAGTAGSTAPSHSTGTATDGTVTWQYLAPYSDYNSPTIPACEIKNNKIISIATSQPGGSRGIYVSQDNYNEDTTTEIEENKVYGFYNSIVVIDSTSSDKTQTFNIRRNIVSSDIRNITTNYPNKGKWYLEDNRMWDNTPIPSVTPTEGFWNKGQKVEFIPVSGGYSGAWCTTAGHINSIAWAATTAKVLGDRVNANDKVYQVTVAGTTGSTAPSHTSGIATDGTVTWAYVGPLCVFKDYGLIT